ncbi:MAG: LytTR family transcriptional regulator [Kordiimonadaceae bacterium]|nr:LytTR family transcriptional regulator [Kordiimonadaceae bacterium]MBT6328760.1 LytTR family transcriptional regulator [Kordiimonadaceae bacterium]
MNRFKIILIGTLSVTMLFSVIIYLRVNMAPDGKNFIPIFLWQMVVWSPWLLYGHLNSWLDHRYPIVEQPILYWVLRHSALCALVVASHVVWFFMISSNFSPFLGVENTGYGAFFFFFIMWGICDFLIYWTLLGIYALQQLLSVSPSEAEQAKPKPDYFLLKTTGQQSSVRISDILWIEAEDYCCRVHTETDNYLVRQSLNSFEKSLPGENFLRIHRSTIVNVAQVELIEKQQNKRHIVRLRNGTQRAISPNGRQKLLEILEK